MAELWNAPRTHIIDSRFNLRILAMQSRATTARVLEVLALALAGHARSVIGRLTSVL